MWLWPWFGLPETAAERRQLQWPDSSYPEDSTIFYSFATPKGEPKIVSHHFVSNWCNPLLYDQPSDILLWSQFAYRSNGHRWRHADWSHCPFGYECSTSLLKLILLGRYLERTAKANNLGRNTNICHQKNTNFPDTTLSNKTWSNLSSLFIF